MITEDYVSFEVARLLKEKGFNEPIRCWYDNFQDFHEEGVRMSNTDCLPPTIMCPTHQMAIKWLREKYNIYISIQPDFPSDKDYKMCWCWSVSILYENYINMKANQCYMKIYEEAIKYCLENLI